MSADPDQVVTRLALLQSEMISPDTNLPMRSYATVPYTISTMDMPLVVNFVGAMVGEELIGSDERAREFSQIRQYKMVLYHSPYGSGIEGEKLAQLMPYFDLFHVKFGAWPHLRNLGDIIDSDIQSDTGMGVVKFNNQDYYGISFTLQVTGRHRHLLGAND